MRTDFLSRASKQAQHAYRLLLTLFPWLDERWGPHSIDHFACPATCQPLAPLEVLLQVFSPGCDMDGRVLGSVGDGNNWLFLHVSDILRMIAHLCASRTVGTLIVPFAAWAPWLASLWRGRRWAAGVKGLIWHRGLACRHPCWTRCSCPKAWIHRTATPVLLAHSSLIQHTMGSRPSRLSRALRLLAVQRR